jgi:hypothetical protein
MSLPDIQGLTPKHLEAVKGYNVPHLCILGVMVHPQLKWGPQIDHVRETTLAYNLLPHLKCLFPLCYTG